MEKKQIKTENVTEETAKPIEPNNVVTQEMFSSSKMLDMIALNNELNSMNKGELRFTVIKKGEYKFDRTDKEGKPQFDHETGAKLEIVSPFVEVTGEGLKGKISTKRLKKEEIELLNVGQSYYGTYILTNDDSMNFQVDFTSVVPFNQELQSRAKIL
jgi:hypothetical protein